MKEQTLSAMFVEDNALVSTVSLIRSILIRMLLRNQLIQIRKERISRRELRITAKTGIIMLIMLGINRVKASRKAAI